MQFPALVLLLLVLDQPHGKSLLTSACWHEHDRYRSSTLLLTLIISVSLTFLCSVPSDLPRRASRARIWTLTAL